MNTVADCRLVTIPVRKDPRGSLCFMETGPHIPFEVRRIFTLFDLPEHAVRGGHAHKDCHQFLFAMSGRFMIALSDGVSTSEHLLESPENGLHVPPGIWLDLRSEVPGGVLTVLASHGYDEADYLRERGGFLAWRGLSPVV